MRLFSSCLLLFLLFSSSTYAQVEVELGKKRRTKEGHFSDIDKVTGKLISPNLSETSDEAYAPEGRPQPRMPLYRTYRDRPDLVIVGEVGRYVLTRLELDRMVRVKHGDFNLDDEDEYRVRHFEKILTRAQNEVLTDWAIMKTLVLSAEAAGFTVSKEEAQNQMNVINEELQSNQMNVVLQDSVKVIGLSSEQMLEEISNGMLIDKFITADIKKRFSEQNLQDIYDRNPGRYMTQRRVLAWEIFKRIDDDMGREEIKEIRKELYDLRKKIIKAKAANFQALASEESDTPDAMQQQGRIGWLTALSSMDQQLLIAILKLKPGQVSKIVKTSKGYYLFMVSKEEPATGVTWDDFARERVMKYLLNGYKTQLTPKVLKMARFPVRLNAGGLRLVGEDYPSKKKKVVKRNN